MKGSTDRILTTHAAAFRGPSTCSRWLPRKRRPPVDAAAYAVRLREAVGDIVHRQVQLGVDVIDDGEMSKPGFIHYVNERLAGFEPSPEAPARSTWAGSREAQSFPEFYDWFSRRPSESRRDGRAPRLHRPRSATRAMRCCRPTSPTCEQRLPP